MVHIVLCAAVLLVTAVASPVLADFDEGVAAYKRGDYATAQREFRVLAEQGHDKAQFNLGLMYSISRDGSQDDVRALMWFNLAASQGNKPAAMVRDIVAETMTPADISMALRLAREWAAKHQVK